MKELVVLAFDLGASSGRAMIGFIDEDNRRVRVEELRRWPNGIVRVRGSLYWDILRLWDEVKESIRLAYRRFGDRLVSVGVDTWGIDFALLDAAGELLDAPHSYRDPRAKGMMDEVVKLVGRDRIYECTGAQFIEVNTLYHLYAVAKRRPHLLRAAKTFLMVPDLFNYWLTGEVTAEFTEATTTQFFDVRRRTWCYEVLQELGIPTEIFPTRIIDPGTLIGPLDRLLAEELGVSPELKVVAPATHDTASAVAAAPLVDERTAYISSGTWSLAGVELSEPLISPEGLRYNFTNEGGAFGTITYLKDLQGMWVVDGVRDSYSKQGLSLSYDDIVRLASQAPGLKAFVDTDHPRLVAPLDMTAEIRSLLRESGQPVPEDLGGLFRVVFESLAFKYRLTFEQAEKVTGRRLERVNIIGGGSRNELLNQLTANFTNMEVYAGPVEATTIGNVLLQAAGLGVLRSLSELREYVRNSFELRRYEPTHDEAIEEAYQRYLRVVGG